MRRHMQQNAPHVAIGLWYAASHAAERNSRGDRSVVRGVIYSSTYPELSREELLRCKDRLTRSNERIVHKKEGLIHSKER